MAMQNPSTDEWSPCLCQSSPLVYRILKEFASQMLWNLTNASFVLCAKVNSKDSTGFLPWFISLDTTWHVIGRDVFFNKKKPVTSDDMNFWVLLWLGHALPKAAGWVPWPFFEQPYFHVSVTQLWEQPKIISSQVLQKQKDKTKQNKNHWASLPCFKLVKDSSQILYLSSNFNN
jgi:hypothetical protein